MAEAIKNKGSTVRIWGRFSDPDTKEPLDPTTLSVKLRLPDGTFTTKTYPDDGEITRTDVGVFYLPYTLAQAGQYCWWWTATNGAGKGVVVYGSLQSMSRGNT